jgi:hypothetical protein
MVSEVPFLRRPHIMFLLHWVRCLQQVKKPMSIKRSLSRHGLRTSLPLRSTASEQSAAWLHSIFMRFVSQKLHKTRGRRDNRSCSVTVTLWKHVESYVAHIAYLCRNCVWQSCCLNGVVLYALSKVRRCLRHNLCSQPYGSKSLVRSTGSAVWNF